MDKKRVAFICVHNSCRSQIAEALGKHLVSTWRETNLISILRERKQNHRSTKMLFGL